jgi:SAM-dependent methyltransferase
MLHTLRTRLSDSEIRQDEVFAGISDEDWFWLLDTGVTTHFWLGNLLPTLPAAALQETYTGAKGHATLREGYQAYRLFKTQYERCVGPLSDCRGVLDFGCGWGRIIRYFLKDVPADRIHGVDHSKEVIESCRETNRWCHFELIEPNPPTGLPSESFDLIYLYSVFSHLPEILHQSLLEEFSRLLLPGGLLIATTRDRNFIEHCDQLRQDPKLEQKPDWLKVSARAFVDCDAALAAYDAGKFCYGTHGFDGRWSFWGEAAIPRGYVEREWTKIFDLRDYIDDRRLCPQNVIVVQKPLNVSAKDGTRSPIPITCPQTTFLGTEGAAGVHP